MKKRFIIFIAGFFALSTIFGSFTSVEAATPEPLPEVFISELKTGHSGASNDEFIELYFTTPQPSLEVTVEYIPPTHSNWSKATKIATVATLENGFVVLARQEFLPEADIHFTSALNNNAGHIRLVNQADVQLDCISWGSVTAQFTDCSHVTQSAQADESIQRTLTSNGMSEPTIASPITLWDWLPESPATSPDPDETPITEEYLPIHITELLPDPAPPKNDKSDEFIELYNPNNTPVNLEGYTLFTGSSFNYRYVLPEMTIAANSYLAFYSSETKLVLSNTSGRAKITSPDESVVFVTDEYSKIGADQAWALIDNKWQITNKLTPGEKNILELNAKGGGSGATKNLTPCPEGKFRNPATNRCKNIETAQSSLTPCKEGQERNPDTNRCRSVTTQASALTPCKPGQERNPATNRCRSVTATNSTLTPCKPGQERNPETNRCRKIASSNGLTPCKEGYERNPETNRCRKKQEPLAAANHGEEGGGGGINFKIIGAVLAATAGYAAFQYRTELANAWFRIKAKISRINSSNAS